MEHLSACPVGTRGLNRGEQALLFCAGGCRATSQNKYFPGPPPSPLISSWFSGPWNSTSLTQGKRGPSWSELPAHPQGLVQWPDVSPFSYPLTCPVLAPSLPCLTLDSVGVTGRETQCSPGRDGEARGWGLTLWSGVREDCPEEGTPEPRVAIMSPCGVE